MLEDGLSYPNNGENPVAQYIIGGALWFFTFFVIPLFLITGYHLATLREVINGSDTPPSFDDWGTYAVDSVKYVVVYLAYTIVPFILIGIASYFAMIHTSGPGLVGTLLLLVTLVVALGIMYTLPGVTAEYAASQSIASAFDIPKLTTLWASTDYLFASIIAIFAGIAITVVFSIIGMITFGIGYLLYPFVYFYYFQFCAYVYGKAYRETYHTASDTATSSTASADTATAAK